RSCTKWPGAAPERRGFRLARRPALVRVLITPAALPIMSSRGRADPPPRRPGTHRRRLRHRLASDRARNPRPEQERRHLRHWTGQEADRLRLRRLEPLGDESPTLRAGGCRRTGRLGREGAVVLDRRGIKPGEITVQPISTEIVSRRGRVTAYVLTRS